VAADNTAPSGVAGRYANALYELAQQEKSVDAVQAELDRFETMIAGSPDLDRLVRSPAFTSEEQTRAVTAILKQAEVGGLAANFIKLVTSNRRLFALRGIIKTFRALVARNRGETTAEVTVAEPLSDAHLASLKDALKQATGKDVALDVKVEPAIIGGLTVKVGSRMIDASLRTKLNAIKFAMKEAR
jgi:F-type H+-transporting ATPase subunit delta